MLPTGRQIKAARILLGWEQRYLAKQAGLNPATLSRMESSGSKTVRGHGSSIQAVVEALARSGVEIEEDAIRFKPKGRPRLR
jgi:transcriptional regulator with XRE-family HTH domain